MLPPSRTMPAAQPGAAHRHRPKSERGYFNLRTGALGRVCAGPTRVMAGDAKGSAERAAAICGATHPPAIAPKSLSAGTESLSLIANPPLQWRGRPSRRREASKALKLRDKEQWPTKGSLSLHA